VASGIGTGERLPYTVNARVEWPGHTSGEVMDVIHFLGRRDTSFTLIAHSAARLPVGNVTINH
jgi:hypothetical protein